MIEVWTDGSCNVISKRKAGGWAYIIKYESTADIMNTIMVHGSTLGTTVNQMELMAILNAIKKIGDLKDTKTDKVTIYSDSEWAVRCLTGVYNCRARVVVSYLDEIEWATGPLKIKYGHIPGHSGIPENELVDQLAVDARRMKENAPIV